MNQKQQHRSLGFPSLLRLAQMASAAALIVFSQGCDDSSSEPDLSSSSCAAPTTCEPTNGEIIELVCPQASEELTPGQTLTMHWRADNTDFTGFRPRVSLDNGKTFDDLATESVLAEGSDKFVCASFTFTVPTDGSWTPEGTDNAAVVLRVQDYNSAAAAMRDQVTVTVTAP